MFERFTDQARHVVVLAQEEARDLGHNYIGTEHILLGLLREDDGLARQALDALGVSLAAAREQVVEIAGRGVGSPASHIPFTPRSKKVLELSLREALQLGDDHIGTEHVLLGLAREGEGVGARVLVALGAPADRVQAQVSEAVRTAPAESGRARSQRVAVPRGVVEQFSTRMGEVTRRLDEISARLTAVESLLAEMSSPPARPPRKPPAGGSRSAAGPRKPPARGPRKPPPAEPGEPPATA